MNITTLRRIWPSVRHGITLGCLAAFIGSLVLNLLVYGFVVIAFIKEGSFQLFRWESWYWLGSFLLTGVLLSFLFGAVPGSLGGGILGLTLFILAHRTTSSAKLGILIGCLIGGLAGILSLLFANNMRFHVYETWLVSLIIGIAVFTGGWVGRRLAVHQDINPAYSIDR